MTTVRTMMSRKASLVGLGFCVGVLASLAVVWAVLVAKPVPGIVLWLRDSRELRLLENKARQDPGNAHAWEGLAQHYSRARRYDDALACAEKAAGLDPENLSILSTYGGIASSVYKGSDDPDTRARALSGLKRASSELLALCEKAPSYHRDGWWFIQQCVIAARLNKDAGQLQSAARAYGLAVDTAKEWTESEYEERRKQGQNELQRLLQEDVYGLASLLNVSGHSEDTEKE